MIKKYLVSMQSTELYEVEAENEDGALDAYDRLTEAQLKSRDIDGDSGWDRPWDVSEATA